MSDRHGYNITDQYAAYFLTFTIVDWIDLFTRRECRDILIYSMKYCQKNKGLIILAYVIMSNHIHVVWRADEKSDGLSAIVRDLRNLLPKHLSNGYLIIPRKVEGNGLTYFSSLMGRTIPITQNIRFGNNIVVR